MTRRRRTLVAALCAFCAAAFGVSPAYAISLGPSEPHSPNAEAISTTYWVMIVIVALVVVAINAALIAAVLRFRERRGHEPRRVSAGRRALALPAAGLGLAVTAIFVFGVVMTADVRELEPSGPNGLQAAPTAQVGVKGAPPLQTVTAEAAEDGPLVIDATAQQWLWRFEYPGGRQGDRTFSYGELVVPVDTAVVLNIRSTDVLHSWWVPALGGQVQAAPGEVSRTWFKVDEPGRYAGRSTVFSGTAYPAMRAWVRAVPAAEYEAYVEQRRADLTEAQAAVELRAGEVAE